MEHPLTVVLVAAHLETTRMRKSGEFSLLNSEDHSKIIAKLGAEPSNFRPDILHQSLLSLLDSPLAKAGRLQIYIHTHNNVLIYVSPALRVPRTYKRFAGLITQLLHTRKIKAAETNQKLMKVIKNPVTKHLPEGAVKISLSVESPVKNLFEYVKEPALKFISEDPNVPPMAPVFMIGACPHGHPTQELDYRDECISISNYPLSAAAVASRLTSAFELLWNIS